MRLDLISVIQHSKATRRTTWEVADTVALAVYTAVDWQRCMEGRSALPISLLAKAIAPGGEQAVRLMAFKIDDGRPSRCNAEKTMATSEGRAVNVLLTEEHLRKIIDYYRFERRSGQAPARGAKVVGRSLGAVGDLLSAIRARFVSLTYGCCCVVDFFLRKKVRSTLDESEPHGDCAVALDGLTGVGNPFQGFAIQRRSID